MTVIDAHLHIWQRTPGMYSWLTPELGAIYADFDAPMAHHELTQAGVDGAILVQADDSALDSEAMFSAAALHEWILGVVAWVPLDTPEETTRLLDRWAGQPTFCGVRQLVHDDPRSNFYELPEVQDTARELASRGVPLDIPDAWPRDLAQIVGLADRHPELVVVLDHLGKPPVDCADLSRWETVFRSLGERPNIVLKFSGLSHPQRAFTRENAQGLFDLSLEAFGARRIMIGSDWPLTQAFGGYQATWSTTNELLGQLGESERSSIRCGTAKQIYGASTRLANMTTKETG